MIEQPYLKKTIVFEYAREKISFNVSQSLFSSHQIDRGTSHLLKSIPQLPPQAKILDLGCGYGPLGITLKKLHPNAEVHMIDRDALAVEFTKQNAQLNNLDNLKIYGSLGYDSITETDFDLIVSNIPAKVGNNVLKYLLTESNPYLKPTGTMAIVLVKELKEIITPMLNSPGIKITYKNETSGHIIIHYTFTQQETKPVQSALQRGVFDRTQLDFKLGSASLIIKTASGLPEFDSLDFQTELLEEKIGQLHNKTYLTTAIINPNQGIIPVMASKTIKNEKMLLISRDLLSLEYSKNNLILNQITPEKIHTFHTIDLAVEPINQIDLLIYTLREDEDTKPAQNILSQAESKLNKNGEVLIVGESTPITRLLETEEIKKNFQLLERDKHKGRSSLHLRLKT